MPEAKKVEDRGLLKRRLYQDQATLIQSIKTCKDDKAKELLQYVLDLVNDYILICVSRNKF